MIYPHKFNAIWKNASKTFYCCSNADFKHKVEEIKRWCDLKGFKHPEIKIINYAREDNRFPNQEQVDKRFWRKS